ncbi:hypothetical protein ACVIRO_001255 [Rhizobium ruizarguesonis]
MADTFNSATHVYPMGSFYQDLANRIVNLETLIGTGEGAVPDFSITQYKLADDALAGKINSAPAGTSLDDADIIPVITAAGLVKLAVTNIFTTGRKWVNAIFDSTTFRLKNAAGFTLGLTFPGTANRTITLPDKDLVLDPGWEVIEEATPAAATSYVRTGLGAYKELKLIGWLRPSATTSIDLQFSNDGGTTWITTADHLGSAFGMLNLSAQAGGTGTYTAFKLSWTQQNSALDLTFNVMISAFNKTRRASMTGQVYGSDTNPYPFSYMLCHATANTGAGTIARNAIRIIPASGTLTGQFTLLGKRG